MRRFNMGFTRNSDYLDDCPCDCIPPGPWPPTPASAKSSCYLEAVGTAQSVSTGQNIKFETDADSIDIAGYGISLDQSGQIFTISIPGLYLVELSLNVEAHDNDMVVCLLEKGSPSSGLSFPDSAGNVSHGALINVTKRDLPFTLSVNNFASADMRLCITDSYENTACSIRILRFADGPNMLT